MSAAFSKKTNLDSDEPRPSKGQTSRTAILHTAAKLATMKGFDGLSIGDLAAEVGMSKSGLYAHFKSKEELESFRAGVFLPQSPRNLTRAPARRATGFSRCSTRGSPH
jgi:tetracycline repressor-like protein